MRKYYFLLLVFTILTGSQGQSQESIPVDEFAKKIKEPGGQILDVRTADEFNSGHIQNALQADWTNRAQFNDRTKYLDKSKTVYIYCLSGGRSSAAAEVLRQEGYNVYNLQGGITSWKKAGKPLEGLSEKNKISEDQYITLTKSGKLVLVDFGASWCPPCKKMEPVIEDIKKNMADRVLVKFVDGGENTAIMNSRKVEALPTFIIYKSGLEVWRKQGVISRDDLAAVINKYQ
jgi:rhodanese-related sulfurtransferase